MTIGLTDWHIYEIGSGHRTALRQTQTQLFLVIARPSGVEWRRYADKHGMVLEASGTAASLDAGLVRAMKVTP